WRRPPPGGGGPARRGGRRGPRTPPRRQPPRLTLIAPEHAHHDALDGHVVLVDVNWRHRLVRRLQANAPVALAIKLLDRGRRVVDERNDRVAVVGRVSLVDHDEIAVPNLFVDHRVASDAQHEVITSAPNERLGYTHR